VVWVACRNWLAESDHIAIMELDSKAVRYSKRYREREVFNSMTRFTTPGTLLAVTLALMLGAAPGATSGQGQSRWTNSRYGVRFDFLEITQWGLAFLPYLRFLRFAQRHHA
jgi:hypothetical protein